MSGSRTSDLEPLALVALATALRDAFELGYDADDADDLAVRLIGLGYTVAPIGDADAPVGGLREGLRAVLRDFDREPTEMYLTEAERIFRATSSADAGAGGLAEAWEAAEAALPDDQGMWLIQGVQLVDTSDSEDLNDEQLEWEAEAVDHRRGGQPQNVTALGPTPAAALRALAARLQAADEGGGG